MPRDCLNHEALPITARATLAEAKAHGWELDPADDRTARTLASAEKHANAGGFAVAATARSTAMPDTRAQNQAREKLPHIVPSVYSEPQILDVAEELLTALDWEAAETDPLVFRGMDKELPLISAYYGFPDVQRYLLACQNYHERRAAERVVGEYATS